MHSTTTTTTPPPPPPLPLPQTLDLIHHLLSLLLLSSLTVKSFITRWQILRTKLTHLQITLTQIIDSTHYSENPLLIDLLPTLLSSLTNVQSLLEQCQKKEEHCFGKLRMQSDIDIASSLVSSHLHDLDLLIKSGVLRQSNAIVLSQPGPGSSKEDLGFFVKDLFARLQVGGIEFKKKALDSLLELLKEDEKSAIMVAKEGDMRYLVHLLDSNHLLQVREQAVIVVSILANASDLSRNSVFEEGGLGPLLRVLESGSLGMKEKAAMAIEAITSDPENAWAVSAYGGVAILIDACRSGSPLTQSYAAGSLKNVAPVEDIRVALAEEGGVSVLVHLLSSNNRSAQEKAANCLWILASASENFKNSILQEGALQKLLQLLQGSSNPDTLEHVLRAIYSLSGSVLSIRILSYSTPFLLQLAEIIKHGNPTTQQISASILCNLSIADSNKRLMSGCMGSLVKMMESTKPIGLQETASKALVSLLSIRSNRKELVRDDKSVLKLVQMLDPKNELVCKKFPICVISSILAGGSNGCRKKLVSIGAFLHLQKLSDMDVPGAKKALQRLAGNRLKNIFARTWRE
ncbi:hypothetical protein AQUCO_02800032v1 [Aquilegia coerulea]|uniref:DUF7032 domain-containing protein n=1 Tax=Aquilegia coerulea TaxID=218851 RepID=A0A2G5D3L9_AQUCA|nr:hypothetical protein AQUCO_02800032v1 [Aquilegia coerulea]